MKKLALILVLSIPLLGRSEKHAKANPGDYNIAVHVQSSKLVYLCRGGFCFWVQHLQVQIGGKKYELSESIQRTDLIRIGDYNAKIDEDETDRSYEYQRIYEFRFPDGLTGKYSVVGESE